MLPGYSTFNKPVTVCLRISTVGTERQDPKSLQMGRVHCSLYVPFTVLHEGKSGPEPEAGAGAEAAEACLLLMAHSAWFLTAPPAQG